MKIPRERATHHCTVKLSIRSESRRIEEWNDQRMKQRYQYRRERGDGDR